MCALTTATKRASTSFHELANQEADLEICGRSKRAKVEFDNFCRYEYQKFKVFSRQHRVDSRVDKNFFGTDNIFLEI